MCGVKEDCYFPNRTGLSYFDGVMVDCQGHQIAMVSMIREIKRNSMARNVVTEMAGPWTFTSSKSSESLHARLRGSASVPLHVISDGGLSGRTMGSRAHAGGESEEQKMIMK